MKELAVPIAFLAIAVACTAPPGADTDTTWVGTITTEGDVTTVVNESGSVWGGTATLVEEASIGVESGAEEYMFGRITSVYATDGRIYVVDDQVPALRVYDLDGNFVRNLGRSGQGPGEYVLPSTVTVDSLGRVFLLDTSLGRFNVYGPGGENLDPWLMPRAMSLGLPIYPFVDEAVWMPMSEPLDEQYTDWRWGLQPVGAGGPYGEVTWIPWIEFERVTFDVPSGRAAPTPFSPWQSWSPTPNGDFLVGASDKYRFEIHHRDGLVMVVERYWEPAPISAEQKEWERRRELAFQREYNDPTTSWDGAEMPDHKPAFISLFPTFSGEVWVSRQEPSVHLTDCAEDPLEEGSRAARDRPCWTDERAIDVFGADGHYLGELNVPDGFQHRSTMLSIDTPRVVAVYHDEAGTIMVKRYRLVLPGEE